VRARWRGVPVLLALLLILSAFPGRAYALGLTTGTRHAVVRNKFTTSSIGGGYAEWVTQPISAAWSSTNNTRFIVQSLWINTDNYSSSWIEVGFLDGAHTTSSGYTYAHGFYTARGIVSGGVIQAYTEYLISGPSTNNGTNHTYEVQYNGNNSWGAYVDFQLGQAWSGAPGADAIDVGLETNTSASSASRITTTRLQYRDPNDTGTTGWHYWTSGVVYNEDLNYTNDRWGMSVGWSTQFTSSYNEKIAQ